MEIETRISRRSFLASVGGAAVAPVLAWATDWARPLGVPTLFDHLILGCADLDRGIAFVEQRTGLRAVFGGVHPGRGTRNALLSLGERRYLEIIAPDPEQNIAPGASVPGARPLQVAKLRETKEPRIFGWAAHRDNLEQFAARLRETKIEFVGPGAGSRTRPDGKVLRWKTVALKDDQRGLLPFFIEWSPDSVHPSVDAPKGCTLQSFSAAAPNPDNLAKTIKLLEIDLPISSSADELSLHALIVGPKGRLFVSS